MEEKNQQIIYQGWATKLGGFIKSWRRRWFVLSGMDLSYYKGPGRSLCGVIHLMEVTEVAPFPECKKQPAFKIIIPNVRTYQIVTDTADEVELWVHAIEDVRSGRAYHNVSVDDFQILKVLGKGSYGKVQLVKHKETGRVYAMKSLSKRVLAENNLVRRTVSERDVLLQANHPFLVSAKYTFQTNTKIFLVMDYVPGGELFSRLRIEHKFSIERVRYYGAMLLLAIGHLHSIGVIHRDLKPENILLDQDGYIKLTDFGLVRTKMSINERTTTFCGTPEYISPEMVQGLEYGFEVDWWALGILIYEMLYGIPPFYDTNANAMYRAIIRDPIQFPADATQEAKDLISRLLDRNPNKRLGSGESDFEEVKSHPFFGGLKWKELMKKTIDMEWKPPLKDFIDVSQFDKEFTEEEPNLSYEDPRLVASDVQRQLKGFTFFNDSVIN